MSVYTPSAPYFPIRFLHGAAAYPPLDIHVAGQPFAEQLPFGEISAPAELAGGLIMLSIGLPRQELFNQPLELPGSEPLTLAIVESDQGLALIEVPDSSAEACPEALGHFRAVNLVSPALPLNLEVIEDGPVFSDLYFSEITDFLATPPKHYDFAITCPEKKGPLLRFPLEIAAGSSYTAYILGRGTNLRVMIGRGY